MNATSLRVGPRANRAEPPRHGTPQGPRALRAALSLAAALVLNAACTPAPESNSTAQSRGEPPTATDAPRVRVLNASPYVIAADPELEAFVTTTAETAIAAHCVECHGADLTGRPGVPNLVDFDWLWGITFEETTDVGPVMAIEQTILYGVRNRDCPEIADQSLYGGCADTRYSEMPSYSELDIFTEQQIDDLTEYTVSLSGGEVDPQAVDRGATLWPICTECHGPEGTGYKPYGGPDLTDDVTLYGSDRDTIRDVIANGRLGKCPPWGQTLDASTIKALAVYIWRKANGG
jgi:cytochrome c oxidase cbb3-type subunit 3